MLVCFKIIKVLFKDHRSHSQSTFTEDLANAVGATSSEGLLV